MSAPEPGAVVLTAADVALLRQLLARENDETLADEVRQDARIQLCGYLAAALDVRKRGTTVRGKTGTTTTRKRTTK